MGVTDRLKSGAGGVLAADVAPKRGGILEFSVENEIGNYYCHANTSFAAMHPLAPHYSTLLKFDGTNYPQVKGDLADSWSVSADKQTYTFKLRSNVLFHDGSRMTSADVKASYDRIAHPPEGVTSARQVTYSAVAAIDTPDVNTVMQKVNELDQKFYGGHHQMLIALTTDATWPFACRKARRLRRRDRQQAWH